MISTSWREGFSSSLSSARSLMRDFICCCTAPNREDSSLRSSTSSRATCSSTACASSGGGAIWRSLSSCPPPLPPPADGGRPCRAGAVAGAAPSRALFSRLARAPPAEAAPTFPFSALDPGDASFMTCGAHGGTRPVERGSARSCAPYFANGRMLQRPESQPRHAPWRPRSIGCPSREYTKGARQKLGLGLARSLSATNFLAF